MDSLYCTVYSICSAKIFTVLKSVNTYKNSDNYIPYFSLYKIVR